MGKKEKTLCVLHEKTWPTFLLIRGDSIYDLKYVLCNYVHYCTPILGARMSGPLRQSVSCTPVVVDQLTIKYYCC